MLMYLVLIIFRLLVLRVESLAFVSKTLWKVQKLFFFPRRYNWPFKSMSICTFFLRTDCRRLFSSPRNGDGL